MNRIRARQVVEKDPNAIKDWGFDASDWLNGTDTISSFATLTIDSNTTTDPLAVDSQSNTTTTMTGNFSGGKLHKSYNVYFDFTTAAGNIERAVLTIRIENN